MAAAGRCGPWLGVTQVSQVAAWGSEPLQAAGRSPVEAEAPSSLAGPRSLGRGLLEGPAGHLSMLSYTHHPEPGYLWPMATVQRGP